MDPPGLCRFPFILLIVVLAGCKPDQPPEAPSSSPLMGPPSPSSPADGGDLLSGLAPNAPAAARPFDQSQLSVPRFDDVRADAGLDFTYENGANGNVLMVEATGGGGGWLDLDGDRHWDLYLVQGGNPAAPPGDRQPNDRLFRNRGDGSYVDVTDQAGIKEFEYGQGVAVGDFNGDGFDDLYVTTIRGNSLLRNQGDGTFENVTAQAGVADGRWSTSAAWGDLDRDGLLELYVCNYLQYDARNPRLCFNRDKKPAMCHPRNLEHWPDECYWNRGDGTFAPQSNDRGLFGPGNKALGVAIADFNNDAWPDVYVANDTTANFMFVNDQAGHFKENGLVLGCALSADGLAQASMGLGMGDYDHDGWLDLYSTHYTLEYNTLYRNLGPAGFQDVTALVGLVQPTWPKLGFGAVMADFNLDGQEEILVANGHVDPTDPYEHTEFEMEPQLFTFAGEQFVDCGARAGDYFKSKVVGRAVALCDDDSDGDLDVLVVHQNAPAALLRNRSDRGHWLSLSFVGRHSNRRGIGVRATVRQESTVLIRELAGGTSYCASHQPVLVFGLGANESDCTVDVRWPDGRLQTIETPVDRPLLIVEPD
jgi:hypothetical protein